MFTQTQACSFGVLTSIPLPLPLPDFVDLLIILQQKQNSEDLIGICWPELLLFPLIC